jgi:hypothetical protein
VKARVFVAIVAIAIPAIPRVSVAQEQNGLRPNESTPADVAGHGGAFVHIDSPAPVDLERETGVRYQPFDVVCTSPCDTFVPAEGRYRVTSTSMRTSRSFSLPRGVGKTTIRVTPSSSAAFFSGFVLIGVGAIAITVAAAATLADGLGDGPATQSNSAAPAVAGVGGLAAIVTGLVLVLANGRSTVALIGHDAAPDIPRPAPPGREATPREWTVKALTVPILRVSF